VVPRVLVAASASSKLGRIARWLGGVGVLVSRAGDTEDLWKHLGHENFDLVLLRREDVPALSTHLISEIRALPDGPDVAVIASEENPEVSAELLTAGCLAVIYEGLSEATLVRAIEALLQRRREQAERQLDGSGIQPFHLSGYASASPAMRRFLDTARRVVTTDTTLLLLGETGVGKEWLARAVHADGPRAAAPFVAVNCAALPETLLESELFGHTKGAFTGATRARRGYFELAHEGTIFLDEIAELPPHLQVKLLRVLEERRIQPLGSERSIAVDVRVLAATNRDLEIEVREKRFRADLFYRLNVVSLTLPPLRERREDIPELLQSYIDHFRVRLPSEVTAVHPNAREALTAYDWPGNVRELINAVERAVLMTRGSEITLSDLPEPIQRCAPGRGDPKSRGNLLLGFARNGRRWTESPWRTIRQEVLEEAEYRYLSELLGLCSGHVGEAAKRAGMAPRSLFEKMQRYGLRKEDFRRPPAAAESPAR
jgi:DNA-binding NtrC family response regulator